MAAGKLIYGIQQIGVGVSDVTAAFQWYGRNLCADVLVFDDDNTATYMAPYMGGQPRAKRAMLAINMQGGSGYELWQYLDRKPEAPHTPIQLGDLGIYAIMIKSTDVARSYNILQQNGVKLRSDIVQDPTGTAYFFIEDHQGNLLKISAFNSWYKNNGAHMGGVFGCMLGVSDIEKARALYSDILCYDKTLYDETGVFDDLQNLPGGTGRFRRVLLTHQAPRQGGLSALFGKSQLELVQALDRQPVKIYADRYWGDLGFIHLCFDVRGMSALRQECAEKGFPFRVDSENSFKMGEAAGHWSYIEDPDGTLIEFIETHKIPLVKKWNWYIDLRKRDPLKPLPNWLIKALGFNRVKLGK